MTKKLTIEYVQNEFTKRGWKLNSKSKEYNKSQQPLNAVCPAGHETTICWNNLQKGQGCRICSGNDPHTFENVKKAFSEAGCELLATEYKNVLTPMPYKCECGNESEIRFCDFQVGVRCWDCRSKKISDSTKTTEIAMKEFCESKNCKFVRSWIQSKRTRIVYICKCGNESEAYWSNFTRFPNCKKCGNKKVSGDKCHMYDPDREAVALRKKFRKVCNQHIRRFMKATGQKKTKHTHELLGYTPQQLQDHILNHPDYSKVKDGIWHIDHIFPLKVFLDHGILDLRIINALENLRPMAGVENLSKADTCDIEEFKKWIKQRKQLS
jgi:hypothetical protein